MEHSGEKSVGWSGVRWGSSSACWPIKPVQPFPVNMLSGHGNDAEVESSPYLRLACLHSIQQFPLRRPTASQNNDFWEVTDKNHPNEGLISSPLRCHDVHHWRRDLMEQLGSTDRRTERHSRPAELRGRPGGPLAGSRQQVKNGGRDLLQGGQSWQAEEPAWLGGVIVSARRLRVEERR